MGPLCLSLSVCIQNYQTLGYKVYTFLFGLWKTGCYANRITNTNLSRRIEFRSKNQNIYGDKFEPKWDRPFYIETVLGKGAYILRTLEGRTLLN